MVQAVLIETFADTRHSPNPCPNVGLVGQNLGNLPVNPPVNFPVSFPAYHNQ